MTEHRRIAARFPDGIDCLLDDLVVRVGDVRHAVVLSGDGATVSASRGLNRRDAEQLAAVASGFHGLAVGAARRRARGAARQTMVAMEAGNLFVVAAGEGSYLAVLSAATADPALIASETARLVERVEEHLRAHPRLPETPAAPA
ncbi:roadblock/LC7 domain-containing protein [Streptomyces sp. FXJ1.4098]|uniref:roadblock/LC7 domain-containing protein n=1 Tax=Streptomyces sp. NPDC020845 TaxID=3365096 RepID=UPI002993F533|nr:roadblock/LC7 domain-containing protein [Streptomyces sp. FXJ1.4098]